MYPILDLFHHSSWQHFGSGERLATDGKQRVHDDVARCWVGVREQDRRKVGTALGRESQASGKIVNDVES